MTFPIPLLLEAISSGAVRFTRSRVEGYCGYRDEVERVIAVDPTVPVEQLAEDLADHLRALVTRAAQASDPAPPDDGLPHLWLVHSAERPEQPDDDGPEPGPQVVG